MQATALISLVQQIQVSFIPTPSQTLLPGTCSRQKFLFHIPSLSIYPNLTTRFSLQTSLVSTGGGGLMQASQTNTEGAAGAQLPGQHQVIPTQPLSLLCHHCLCSPRPPTLLPNKDIGLQGTMVHAGDSHQHVPKSGVSDFCNFLRGE